MGLLTASQTRNYVDVKEVVDGAVKKGMFEIFWDCDGLYKSRKKLFPGRTVGRGVAPE